MMDICRKLKLSLQVSETAERIYKFATTKIQEERRCPCCGKIKDRVLPHKKSLQSSAIYIASRCCGEWVTQEMIHEITGVAPQTIRKRYKRILKMKGIKDIL